MGVNGRTANGDVVRQTEEMLDPSGPVQGEFVRTSPNTPCLTLCCAFRKAGERKLYAFYARRTRQESPKAFLSLCLLASLRTIITSSIVYKSVLLPVVIISCIFMTLNLIFFLIYSSLKSRDWIVQSITYYIFVMFTVQILLNLTLGEYTVPTTDSLEWTLLLIYASFVLVPMILYQCLVMAVLSVIVHVVTSSVLATRHDNTEELFVSPSMMVAQFLLYVAAFVLGLITHHTLDSGIRDSFVESKASLAVSFQIQESSREQERLLLSVLPKHVADEMIQDLGEEETGQFRKIYMNRHENVSILFADIVGFTALSSVVTSSELVRILNDLFATFDKLAQTFCQLRIKILGDCYYCICGCPNPRIDHAVLSIHMGLAMVDAITQVREKTKSGVNMRVGIHTGPVLGGVLGQVRWQYDVFGKEVTLANKMESGGLPGRVHISQTTADCLNGEFELEPGAGDTREDAIKMAGLKTYLIRNVIKKYPQGTLDENKSPSCAVDIQDRQDSSTAVAMPDNTERFEDALMEREHKTQMNTHLSFLTQHFKNEEVESNYYSATKRSNFWLNIVSMATVTWLCLCALLVANGTNTWVLGSLLTGAVILSIISGMSYMLTKNASKGDSCLSAVGRHILHSRLGQVMWAVLCATILLTTSFLATLGCSAVTSDVITSLPDSNDTLALAYQTLKDNHCLHPQFFTYLGVIVLLAMTSLFDVEFLAKTAVSVVIAVCFGVLHWLMTPYFDWHDLLISDGNKALLEYPYKHGAGVSVILIALGCIVISKHQCRLSRKLFLYKHEISEMRKQVETLKVKNQALIYNILPAHVAKDFIGVKRKDEELYSHAYDAVGVMFASCPNFNDFYTEDAVNNDGLECIRVLNEILSDYDDLLENPKFKSITKIKTIGPTYMAASGMDVAANTATTGNAKGHARWQHLADLIEFILAMNESLDRINVQSFNNFMLRVGMNHGPILAGVIGANKPHYDIWGNTVNVASRMDSTGQLGKIQVVESTMEILRHFGYTFEQRGLIKVKGKGDLMTYFLTGKETVAHSNEPNYNGLSLPNQVEH